MKLIKILGIVMLTLFSLMSVNATVNDSIVYYSLDSTNVSGTTVYDLSINEYNGTCNGMGGDCNLVSGILNNATNFTTSTENIQSTISGPTAGNDISYSFWAKWDTTQIASGGGFWLMVTGDSGNSNIYPLAILSGGTSSLRLFQNGGIGAQSTGAITINNDGNWHHYVAIRANGATNLLLYEDTVLLTNTSVSFVNAPTNNKMVVNGNLNGATGFDGDNVLDEIGVYSRALNSTEIAELYKNGTGFNPYAAVAAPPAAPTPIITFTNISAYTNPIWNNSYYSVDDINFHLDTQLVNTTNTSLNFYYNLDEAGNTLIPENKYLVQQFENKTETEGLYYYNGSYYLSGVIWEDIGGGSHATTNTRAIYVYNNSGDYQTQINITTPTNTQGSIQLHNNEWYKFGGSNTVEIYDINWNYDRSILLTRTIHDAVYVNDNWYAAVDDALGTYSIHKYDSTFSSILEVNNVTSPLLSITYGPLEEELYLLNNNNLIQKLDLDYNILENITRTIDESIRLQTIKYIDGRLLMAGDDSVFPFYNDPLYWYQTDLDFEYYYQNETNAFIQNLADGVYNVSFFVENNETNATSSLYYFTIDTTNPSLTENLPTEIDSYNINLSAYINFSDTNIDTCLINFSTGQNSNCNSTSFTFNLNGNISYDIVATDLAGNTNTTSGVILVNPLQYFTFKDIQTNTTLTNYSFGDDTFTSSPASYKVYDLGLGSHTLTFSKQGYVLENFTFTLNTTSTLNETYYVTPSKIIVMVYDRETRNLITNSTTFLTLIDGVGANGSTTTGLYNFSDLVFQAGEYHIIAENSLYLTETIYFDFTNQEQVNVDIYMLAANASDAGTVTIIAKDQFSQFIQGAICSAKEWIPASSSHETVATALTNVNGEAQLNVEIGTKEYVFVCEKDDVSGSLVPEILVATGESRTIILQPVEVEVTEYLSGFTYTITESINNNISNITFTYSDAQLEVTQACVTFYNIDARNPVELAQTCANSSSATIFQSFAINNSFTLLAEVSVVINDNVDRTIKTFKYDSLTSLNQFLEKYGLDLFIPLLLMIVGLGLGIIMQNIYIALSLMFIMTWFGFFIVPSVVSGGVAVIVSSFILLSIWGGYKAK